MTQSLSEQIDDLVVLARSGDRAALETILQRHASSAIAVAYSILGNTDDALDAAQQGLLQFARTMGKYSGGSVKGHIYLCAHGAAVNLLKERSARIRRETAVALQNSEAVAMYSDAGEREEVYTALREELAKLDVQTATMLAVHHIENRPLSEIASEWNITVDACKKRISRAMVLLRERLANRGVSFSASVFSATCNEVYSDSAGIAGSVSSDTLAKLIQVTLNRFDTGNAFSVTDDNASPNGHIELTQGSYVFARPQLWKKLAIMCFGFWIAGWLWFALDEKPAAAPLVTPVQVIRENSNDGNEMVQADLASRWQRPRLLRTNAVPVSLAVQGNRVLLFAWKGGTTDTETWESRDHGCTWLKSNSNHGMCSISTSYIGVDGRVHLYCGQSASGQSFLWSSSNDGRDFKRSEGRRYSGWYVAGLCPVEDQHIWLATQTYENQESRVRVDLLRDGDLPVEPKTEVCEGTAMGSFLYARDRSTAGMFLTSQESNESAPGKFMYVLLHHKTRDQGKSWTHSKVPLMFSDSEQRQYYPWVHGVTRHNDEISLLLMVQFFVSDVEMDNRLYSVTSNDLGQSWDAPVLLRILGHNRDHAECTRICHVGDRRFIAMNILTTNRGEGELFAQFNSTVGRTPSVAMLDDTSRTWISVPALDFAGVSATPIASCVDKKGLHVAASYPEKGGIIVRSFAPGNWTDEKDMYPSFSDDELMKPSQTTREF
jgi:RNA polymerase sigma factor (sigma-70 family)